MHRASSQGTRQYPFLGLAVLVGAGGWALLFSMRHQMRPGLTLAEWGLFVVLSLLVKGLGGWVVPRENHSLVGIVDLAALLLFGPAGGALVVASASLLYQVLGRGSAEAIRARRGEAIFSPTGLLGYVLFDSGLKVFMALACSRLYLSAGGAFPPAIPLEQSVIWPSGLLFLAWFSLDHLGWAVAEVTLGGWPSVRQWFQAVIGPSLLMELLPLPLSLLLAATYETPLTFALVAAGLVGTSLVIQQLLAVGEKQRQAASELATLNEIARAIVQAELSVEGLAELIYEQANRVMDASSFHLGLFEGDRFALQMRVIEGGRQDPLTVTLSPGEGIVGWMRQSRQPLLVRDFRQEMDRLPARPTYISPRPPRSAVFVPLIAGEEVIGTMSIQSYRPAAYTDQHVRILSFIANQAAVAIEKARLYQTARERALELERIAGENAALYAQVREERDRLQLLYDVSRDLARRLDLEALPQRLLQRTVESLRAEEGTILLLGTRREPPRAITTGDKPPADVSTILERGLTGWVVREKQGTIIADVQNDPRWLAGERPTGSAIAVPILHQDTVWGGVTLVHSQAGFFGPADLALLASMADQAGVVLEAARLYEAQRRRAVQLQTIAQIMHSILSILELDPLLCEVVNLLRDRFGYAHAHVFTIDSSTQEAVFRASTDPDNPFWEKRGGRLSLEEGLVGWVARHGEPAIVGDVSQDPRWLPDQAEVRSEVAVPLQVAGEAIGVLDVQSAETDAFDEEDLFILRTMADEIAVALESARLYAAQQEEAWVLNALLQVAQNIALARDLDELLEVVVRLVPLLVGVERCVLFLHERQDGSFTALHGYGVAKEVLEGLGFTHGDFPALDRVARQANPVALVGQDAQESVPPPLWVAAGRRGMWLFPLMAGGEVSSVLLLGLGDTPYLSSRQQTILAGITHQAGIAIEEARLRRSAAERERLEQELAVARDIQRSLLPPCCPQVPGWALEVAWQSAREVGGDFYDFIRLAPNRLGVVIADVSDKGVPAALFMVLSRSLVRASATTYSSPAEALCRANSLLLEENESGMFVTVFYGVIDLDSGEMRYASAGHNPPLLCSPERGEISRLQGRGVVLGVLEEPHLEEQHVQLAVGDTLVLYTDGVTEAINLAGEQFGEERLREVVCTHRTENLERTCQALLSELEEFSQGQPPFDDLTLVLVRRGKR